MAPLPRQDEAMETEDSDQNNAGSSGDNVSNAAAPVVFNPADYGPVEVPEVFHNVATYEPDGPRLMITQIVNENFKSYAGVQKLGPFHKNFTAIIGPNGSGKSNVIDSMLFVFGYRANKIRSKKISVLIHNSEKHRQITSCSVAVHFQKIVDTGSGDEDYTVVPGSQFVVSRVAHKDNSSAYYVDGKKKVYKEVATMLRGSGIDLDHNRFLILQGEVEQIAMMKPKAQTEHEDGMLEFLEDIVGSNRFKTPIQTLATRVENLNDLRAEKLNRVKAVEKELETLEGPKEQALAFLRLENQLTRLKNQMFQKYIQECSENETKAAAELEKVSSALKEFEDKLNEVKKKKNEKAAEYKKLKKEFDKLNKKCEEAKERFSEMEQQDQQCQEEVKLDKAKLKKLEKTLNQETNKIAELELVPEAAGKACAEMEKKLKNLEKAKEKEEEKEKEVMDSLKDETKELQSAKDQKEAELLEQQGDLNQRKSQLQVAESELELYTQRETAEQRKLEALQRSLNDAQQALADRQKDIEKIQGHVPGLEQQQAAQQAELKDVQNSQTQAETKRHSLMTRVEEARSSASSAKSQGRLMTALTAEKQKGNIPGILGRLGDLGAIAPTYDVAVSTACGSLDHVVVDTVDTGKKCISLLKERQLGRANFIVMEKMERWREHTTKKITTPESVPRLFDLIKVKDEAVKTAFYFALRDTLVAKDMDQGTRIAFGKTRYRVVTLKGELIETSGAMTGGGNSVCKGKMGTSLQQEVDPRELRDMENQLERLTTELEQARQRRGSLEEQLQQRSKDLVTLKHNLEKHNKEVKGLKERVASLKKQESEQEAILKSVTPDQGKLKELEKNVAGFKKSYDKVASTASKLEDEIKDLHEQIMEIGGAKLSVVQSRLKVINSDIDKVTGQITKNNVGVKTAERNLKRSQDKVESVKDEIKETEEHLKDLGKRLTDIEAQATQLMDQQEAAKTAVEEGGGRLTGLGGEVEQLEAEEAGMAGSGLDLKHEHDRVEGLLKENKGKVKHWRKERQALKLSPVTGAEDEDLTLPEMTADELANLSKQEVQYQMTVEEEKLGAMRPNMAAIQEYKKKEEVYLSRVGELDAITGMRDGQRGEHDRLRKQRLDEFMAGFQTITNKLKEMYQMITLGGDAELELVDSLDPFSEGIVFSVRPPKKSWKNISNLSGGEKTLSSLALVFALHHYKPTPLYVMDEIDAALDFKNVSIVANYIKERTKNAQFIIISLRNNMFELADRLVGIYKTHDCTKSVTLNPWALAEGFRQKIMQVHNVSMEEV